VAETPLDSGVAIARDKLAVQRAGGPASPAFSWEVIAPGRGIVTLAAGDETDKRQWLDALGSVLQAFVPPDRRMDPGWRHGVVTGTLWAAAVAGNEPQLRELVPFTASGRAAAASAGVDGGSSGDAIPLVAEDPSRWPTLDIDALDEEGRSPLVYAALVGHAGCMRVLLSAGARLDTTDTELNTVLHIAARRLDAECVAVAAANGLSTEIRNLEDHTALGSALAAYQALATTTSTTAEAGSLVSRALKVIETLLSNGADPRAADSDGWEPLHRIATTSLSAAVPMLVRAGADPNAPLTVGANALTPLHVACGAPTAPPAAPGTPPTIPEHVYVDVTTALAAAGSQPNARMLAKGHTPLHCLLFRCRGPPSPATTEAASAAQRLVAFGARLDVANDDGVAPAAMVEAPALKAALDAAAAQWLGRAPPPSATSHLHRVAKTGGISARTLSVPPPPPHRLSLLVRHAPTPGQCVPEREWPQDGTIPACPLCGAGFTLFSRRHHVSQQHRRALRVYVGAGEGGACAWR